MANISSTYIQIYPKQRLSFGVKEFQLHKLVFELLSNTYGYSYNTPFFSIFGKNGKYLELAYGEKWAPGSIHEYFEANKDLIDVIFYRFYSDSDDYDYINCLSNNEILDNSNQLKLSESRLCRYGFDMIKFQSNKKIDNPSIKYLTDNWYQVNIEGSYLSKNDYCFLLHESNFANYKIDDVNHALWGVDRDVVCDHVNLLELIEQQATIVEYYYKRKMVTYSIEHETYISHGYDERNSVYFRKTGKNNQMIYFPFDSWYNCVDELYLNYINEINPIHNNT